MEKENIEFKKNQKYSHNEIYLIFAKILKKHNINWNQIVKGFSSFNIINLLVKEFIKIGSQRNITLKFNKFNILFLSYFIFKTDIDKIYEILNKLFCLDITKLIINFLIPSKIKILQ